MKDPFYAPMGEIREQKVWKSGTSYVTPIPPLWVERNLKRKNIGKSSLPVYAANLDENTMILSISETPLEEELQSYESKEDDHPLDLTAYVYGAYMKGERGVYVTIPLNHVNTLNALNAMPSKLIGIDLQEQNAEKTYLKFNDDEKPEIKERLSSAYNRINEMYESNKKALDKFPDEKELLKNQCLVDRGENWLDKMSFYMKRLFNRSLFDMKLFNELDIGTRQNILYYDSIVSNTERIGDLHKEISMTIKRLSDIQKKEKDKLDLAPMSEYLTASHTIVTTAFDLLGDKIKKTPKIDAELIDELGIEYIPGLYEKNKAENMVQYVSEGKKYARLLSILQSRIWGLKGNASNIIEAKLNMRK